MHAGVVAASATMERAVNAPSGLPGSARARRAVVPAWRPTQAAEATRTMAKRLQTELAVNSCETRSGGAHTEKRRSGNATGLVSGSERG